jgi:hypothetical protein
MFAKPKVKVRMRRKAWRPLILGVRSLEWCYYNTGKKETVTEKLFKYSPSLSENMRQKEVSIKMRRAW